MRVKIYITYIALGFGLTEAKKNILRVLQPRVPNMQNIFFLWCRIWRV